MFASVHKPANAVLRFRSNSKESISGFSLVELLVVIAVIGILVALLLPALGAVRESAQQVTCKNNLKEIGTATLLFHDAKKHLPTGKSMVLVTEANANRLMAEPGQMSFPNAMSFTPGALFQLLPYIGMEALWEEFDPLANASGNNSTGLNPVLDADNSDVVNAIIPSYLCPSMRVSADFGEEQGPTSYFSSVGTVQPHNQVDHDGAICGGTRVRMRQIRDGTSRTIAFGETDWFGGSSGPRWAGGYATTAQGSTYGEGQRWFFNPITQPENGMSPLGDIRGRHYISSYRSDHPGGVHFVMVDGSVHFIDEGVKREVMDALATRDGGESLGHANLP